ncbi:hypothetical protein [Pseudomonas yamanorum]
MSSITPAVVPVHYNHDIRTSASVDTPSDTQAVPQPVPPGRLFRQMVKEAVKQRLKLYAPVLQPGAFIEEKIKQGIIEFEARTGKKTGLSPDSRIRVDYAPNVPDSPNLHIRQPVRQSQSFTLREIVTGTYQHVIRAMEGPLGVRYKVVGHEQPALIEHLTSTQLQGQMSAALAAYQADAANKDGMTSLYESEIMLRCLEYLSKAAPNSPEFHAVAGFLSGRQQASEVKFHGVTLNGVFLIPMGEGGILFSVDDNKQFHIGTTTNHYLHYGVQKHERVPVYPLTPEFKKWALSKLPVYEQFRYKDQTDAFSISRKSQFGFPSMGIPLSGGQVTHKPFSFHSTSSVGNLTASLYDGFMQRLKSDIDTLVFTDLERYGLEALEISKAILTLYSTAAMFASFGTGSQLFALASGLGLGGAYAAASLGQAGISDRPQESAAYLREAIVAAAMTGAFQAFPLARKLAKGLNYPFKSIAPDLSYYRFINGEAQAKAPRIVDQLLGKVIKPRLRPGAGYGKPNTTPMQMRRTSLGEVMVDPQKTSAATSSQKSLPGKQPASVAGPVLPKSLPPISPDEQARKAIQRSLPIARKKLDEAIRAVTDPGRSEDAKRVCKLFYGSDTPESLQALQRKQQLMKADLDRLHVDNIEFLKDEGAGWSAQLQPSVYHAYKAGDPKAKYIEVNIDGALEYYRDMGSSDDTLANTLIHEMSHGMPADEDFVYAGKLRGAREDIVDLLNLGKSTLKDDFRYLSPDIVDDTVSLFARHPQTHNADSTLFVAALMDQARNNRLLFEANIAAINEAVERAGDGLIKETVAVRIIGKRSAPRRSAPNFLLARHDQGGEPLRVFERVCKPSQAGPRTIVDVAWEVFKWR